MFRFIIRKIATYLSGLSTETKRTLFIDGFGVFGAETNALITCAMLLVFIRRKIAQLIQGMFQRDLLIKC